MSVKYMAAVWDMDLPNTLRWVLMAYADHADHQGRNIRPGVRLMVHKTGLSDRTIQRVTQELLDRDILRVQTAGGGRGLTTVYCINLDAAPIKGDMVTPFPEKGDTVSPFSAGERVTDSGERVTKSGERVTKSTEKGDIAVSPQPYEPINPPEPVNTTTALSARAREDAAAVAAAVLTPGQEVAVALLLEACPDFANPVGMVRANPPERVAGWAIYVADVMTREKRARIKSLSGYLVRQIEAGEMPVLPAEEARRFADEVALARDGAWPADSPWRPGDEEPGPADEESAPAPGVSTGPERDHTWEIARLQLKLQMTRSTWDTWVRDTEAVRDGDTLTVLAANRYAIDWLQQRLCPVIAKTIRSIDPTITGLDFQVRGAAGQ